MNVSYFDALNRVFQSETEGFDGTPVYSDTLFNERGEVTQVSRPYFAGTPLEDVQWTATASPEAAVAGADMAVTCRSGGGTRVMSSGTGSWAELFASAS